MKNFTFSLLIMLNTHVFSQVMQSVKTKNVPSEVGVENAYLYYNTHSMSYFENPSNNFKFLLGYINQITLPKITYLTLLFLQNTFIAILEEIKRHRK